MKILLTSIGTRGDIEPFLALGEILALRGHQVVYSFPQQFAAIIPQTASFHPLSPKVIALIESEEGKIVMGKAGLWKKMKALLYLYKEGQKVNKELMIQQYGAVEVEHPDAIIHNAKCSYPTLWGLKSSKKTILLSPVPFFMHYVKGHAHLGFNRNLGQTLNKLSYALSNYGLAKTIYDGQKFLPFHDKFKQSTIQKQLLDKKMIFSISPSLFPRPGYWPNNAQVLGFHERDKVMDWQPDQYLHNFLKRNDKIIFLTFGSMVNTHPAHTSRLLYQALEALHIPTIVNIASGGLVALPEFKTNQNFHFVQTIPYEWIFPKVYAVIHHGGSGTTHTALKYGCVSLIIPHIIDQFGWNYLIHKLNVGPKGVSINQLTSSNVKKLIEAMVKTKEYKDHSKQLSARMLNENNQERLLQFIETDDYPGAMP